MTNAATTLDLQSALQTRDRAAIARLSAQLLEQRTRLDMHWFSVAQVLVRIGELELAVSAAQRGSEESGGTSIAHFRQAHILSLVGRQEEAIAMVTAIPEGKISLIERDHFLGTCALETGDFELARAAFERVLAAHAGSGVTWLSLSALPPVDDGDLLSRLDGARPAVTATPPDSRARWHYARGAVLDRLGRTDEAFVDFMAGANLVRPTRPYDPDADRREADTLIAEFDRAAIDRIAEQVHTGTTRPILVTGLPRSGTTLVEQILTSHQQVAGGGELPFGSILTREVGGRTLSKLQSFASGHGADQLGQLYLHLGDQRFGEGRRFVDKSLAASRDLGLLACALPEARIVWLRRDPMDCAWSCFRTFFSQGVEWSWSLDDIAAHFQVEDKLHAHWSAVLGDRLLSLNYEELVGDPAAQTRRIFDHAGLDPEMTVDHAHRTQRAVTTASLAQVRQPIYQSSVGSARPYQEQLRPFFEAYGTTASVD